MNPWCRIRRGPGLTLTGVAAAGRSPEIPGSSRVVPGALTRAGYRFVHPDLDGALAAVVTRQI